MRHYKNTKTGKEIHSDYPIFGAHWAEIKAEPMEKESKPAKPARKGGKKKEGKL